MLARVESVGRCHGSTTSINIRVVGLDARPDDELLRAAVESADEQAFAELYRRNVDVVLAFLRRRVPDGEVAFDLTAETFAAAIVGARSYRGDGPVVGWLLGIARNKLLESLRRGRVEAAARDRLAHEPMMVADRDLELVEERAAGAAARLDRALAELPQDMRDAVVARVVEEREYPDIARELSCSEHLVRQRVSRGLRRLRASLERSA